MVPPELPQKRSLLSRCNVRNTSCLLRCIRQSTYHHIPPLLPLYPLGSLLGSVIHTDSDMRLTPVPHSLKTKFRVTCLRRCIYWMVLLYHLFGGLSSGNFKQSGRLFFKIKCHGTKNFCRDGHWPSSDNRTSMVNKP